MLENVIYLKMKNDISFLFGFSLNLYEHPSSVNSNMPLRDLFYVADLLQKIVKDKNLYSSSLVGIPTPCILWKRNLHHKILRRD